ncbi:hypothetical protein EBB79_08605 [Parasedimentitalea marina]|uniref:RiboL-PSP-HEPN domain-containing protein n=2 Tax=Parasedimentitalea marina TaxID=2483033 RepID=A0A3T0N1T3_9RHOB|nr:hypothetical protein EBB79_08605 [Parasedimentitalea marina]
MTNKQKAPSPRDLAIEAAQVFMIFPSETFLAPLEPYSDGEYPCAKSVASAAEGLHSVISAAGLPFQLIQESTMQRRFDRFHAAERILALIPEKPGSGLSEDSERRALKSADQKMTEFLNNDEGSDIIRDQIIFEMDRRLKSSTVRIAAQELLVQTLISTWSIFESFARSFIIAWLNDDPSRASSIIASQDLKDFFGKKVVDLQTIGDHGFDLSKSMGTVLFKDRRLDSLGNIRGAMKAFFNSSNIQTALGKDLWILNQRRHLFVHNRGVVDLEYLKKSGDTAPLGERLTLKCADVEQHLVSVREAIIAVGDAAAATAKSV